MSDRHIEQIARESAEAWRRAALTAEREGRPIAAQMARNSAWLEEHPEGWLAWIGKESNNG